VQNAVVEEMAKLVKERAEGIGGPKADGDANRYWIVTAKFLSLCVVREVYADKLGDMVKLVDCRKHRLGRVLNSRMQSRRKSYE
jgi:hypothetical protein